MAEFSDALQGLLNNCAHNQTELAEKLQISEAHLSDLKQGKRGPSGDLVTRMGEVFDLTQKEIARLHRCAARDRGFEV